MTKSTTAMLETTVGVSLSVDRYNALLHAERQVGLDPSWDLSGEGLLLTFIYNGAVIGVRVAPALPLRRAAMAAALLFGDFPSGRSIEIRNVLDMPLNDDLPMRVHVEYAKSSRFFLVAAWSGPTGPERDT